MDTAQLEQDLNEQIRQATEAAAVERRVERVNGPAGTAAITTGNRVHEVP